MVTLHRILLLAVMASMTLVEALSTAVEDKGLEVQVCADNEEWRTCFNNIDKCHLNLYKKLCPATCGECKYYIISTILKDKGLGGM